MSTKKLISLLLVVLMILPLFMFVGCDNDKDDGNKDKNPSDDKNNVQVSDDPETTAYVKEKYGDYDYNGYEFRILSIDQGEHYYRLIDEKSGNEIWYEEDNADAHQHAVFTRNLLAEELLNIKITPRWGGNGSEVPDKIKTNVTAGGDEFDLALASLNKLIQLGVDGRLYSYFNIPTFDMNESWWDQELIGTYTYKKDYLFAISGDYTVFDDYAVPVIFYNKNVIEDNNLEDPADLVDDGTWTVDAMIEMARKATRDLGDGTMDVSDAWGYVDNDHVLTHLLEGCQTFVTKVDEEGIPQVVCDSQDFVDTAQYLFNAIALNTSIGSFNNDDCVDMMLEDRALFYYELLGAINNFRDMESVFSLLPLPKKDLNQKNYSSIVNTVWATALAVPLTNKHIDQTGVILNVLGGLSTDTVHKALHEVILGPKLFREKRTVDMLKYALDAKAYDWAKEMSWANSFYTIMREMYNSKTFTLSSSLQKKVKVLKKELKIFLAAAK